MNNRFFILLSFLLFTTFAWAQKISGTWNGALNINGSKMSVVFHFDKGKCTIDSPNQGAAGIPAQATFEGDSVKVSSQVIKANYYGKIVNDTIFGSFIQYGHNYPLKLAKGNVVKKRPQTPKPPFQYYGRNVTFTNPKDGTLLAGTVTLPKNYTKNTPIVVMVSGSGLQNRDEEILGHRPFLVIADYLAKHGIGAFRYDDRSVGGSKGNASKATMETFKGDAEAAVDYLKKKLGLTNVGILGHSEGGEIAYKLGNGNKIKFIVSLAGPSVQGNEILINQNYTLLTGQDAPPYIVDKYCNIIRKICDMRINGEKFEDPDAKLKEIATALNTNIPAYFNESLKKVMTSWNPWMDYFIKYNPLHDIQNLKVPILALFGEKDTQVYYKPNMQILIENLPENQYSQVRSFPDLNHLFQHCTTGSGLEYGEIEETISPEILEKIASWIKSIK